MAPDLPIVRYCSEARLAASTLAALGPPKEAARALGVTFPQRLENAVLTRQYEFIAGRAAAGRALRAAGWYGTEPLPVSTRRAPVWPAGFVGSIAHSNGAIWAVAAAQEYVMAVGIDVESIPRPELVGELSPSVMNDDERLGASGWPIEAEVAFTLVFSAKEALYKCLNPLLGVEFDFLDLYVSQVDLDSRQLHLQLGVTLGPGYEWGRQFPIRFGFDAEMVRTAVELVRPAS